MNEDIIEVQYDNIKTPETYTISEASKKLGVSTTKVNHWIFKLNKSQEGFFSNPSKITTNDLEKLELANELLNDGYNYDEVIAYFKDKSKGLVNRDSNTLTRDLTGMDVQVISKSVTLEVKRQTDKIIDVIRDEMSVDLVDNFKEEATKIAQVSLEAMNQSKNEMLTEMQELKEQNNSFKLEIERMYSKQTNELRRKLEEKEQELNSIKTKKRLFDWFKK